MTCDCHNCPKESFKCQVSKNESEIFENNYLKNSPCLFSLRNFAVYAEMYVNIFVHKASIISTYLRIVLVGLKIMLGCEEMHSVVFLMRSILVRIRIQWRICTSDQRIRSDPESDPDSDPAPDPAFFAY